jgi:hypothetical protein
MSTLQPATVIQIKNTCSLALITASGQTDKDDKYETIREAYEQVRALQGATEETDYAETPRAAMEEYLTLSYGHMDKIIDRMAILADDEQVIPSPLPDGLVLVTSGGSGSGSDSGKSGEGYA